MVPLFAQQLRQGQEVYCGRITLRADGLHIIRTSIPWHDLQSVKEKDDGKIVLRTRSGPVETGCYSTGVPHWFLLKDLADAMSQR